jgi:uncharacterized surface protein with fasciclin (FAS1) repeats
MKTSIFKKLGRLFFLGAGLAVTTTACNPEPDESDLYTFTGQTIGSFIESNSELSAFKQIMERVGYDKMMAAYGSYTCFAPVNSGVMAYIDSLYNDTEALIPHNGMSSNSVEGLSDSLCLSIVRYHLSTTYRNAVSMTSDEGGEVTTMLGYTFRYVSVDGSPMLNDKAKVISSDHEVINGIVHVIDNVIPRFTRYIGDQLKRNKETFSIFSAALEETGWDKKLMISKKDQTFTYNQRPRANYSSSITGDTECKVGFTVFAEPDEVIKAALRSEGLSEDLNGLKAYANKVYGGEWKYDYLKENGLTVSTGTDYTEPLNALNMFVAYHILGCSMSANQLVFEKGSSANWNYAPNADPHDYYETMLPHTLLKVWEPHDVGTGKTLLLNRYQTYNTLTNEVGTQGTNHELIRKGITVNRQGSLAAYNGYVHSIDGMLVYDETVHTGVLNERMRFNCTTLFPELITNGYRYWTGGDGNIPAGYDSGRMGIANDFFDNIELYDEGVCFAYALHSNMRCYQSDQLQVWGRFDFAFKLPPVPSGLYEIRIIYPPLSYGGFMQYYIGNSRNIQSMEPLGIPYDYTIDATDPRIGWTTTVGDEPEEDDKGIASDVAMHNRGYMRAPYSFCGHSSDTGWSETNNCRVEPGYGTMVIRSVLGRVQLSQGGEHWLRIKTLDPDNTQLLTGIDFIEVVPVGVVDNDQYAEDWY